MKIDATIHDPRAVERRLLRDTYRTFGCESGDQPTFRYSLLDGVREGYLINPTVVDARTDVTTQLLSDEGFIAAFTDDEGEEHGRRPIKSASSKNASTPKPPTRSFCKTFPGKRFARSRER